MNCSSCNTKLTPVFNDNYRRRTDEPPYIGALRVDLSGGYGMFIDLRPIYKFILCKECATKLVNENLYMKEDIDAY